ncbi:MAG: hypothetical protein U0587_14770 [Candidatus Binatia bacterium]
MDDPEGLDLLLTDHRHDADLWGEKVVRRIRVSPGFIPFTKKGFAGVVITRTSWSESLTAGMMRWPSAVGWIKPACEGVSAARHADCPPGRLRFASGKFWVFPMFGPEVTRNWEERSCSGK